MSISNVLILHGCPFYAEMAMDPQSRTYDKHWLPWLRDRLVSGGLKAVMPLMPSPWQPDYEKFKIEIEKNSVTPETVLVGHSCGCAFFVRWLGETKRQVGKLILVAPWKIPDRSNLASVAFYSYDIDRTIKDRVGEVVIFTSDNEERDGKLSVRLFHDSLGGRIIELPGRGHYTQGDMGTVEFPELLREIIP